MALYVFEPVDLVVFATLILLEGVLSFDNAAIIAALARRLPKEQRRKALLYGLLGAYVFRSLAIVAAAAIINMPLLQIAAAGYLIFLAAKHFLRLHQSTQGKELRTWSWFGLPMFWSTVITIELADIAFALDQIVVAVAFTDKVAIILVAAVVAILMLRLAAFYVSRLMDWFPALEHIAYLVVGLVGVKIVLEYFANIHIHEMISGPVTIGLFVLPILWKWGTERHRTRAAGVA